MPWDPAQYERFARERELPFVDALALVGALPDGARIIDLGCGTGALTEKLAEAYPSSHVLGIDSSTEMLAEAKPRAHPRLRFIKAAIEAIDQITLIEGEDPRWDLIFSHAVLHWLPDHPRLLPRLFARLAPGGRLVVQLPSNEDSIAHRTLRAVADESPFRDLLAGPVRAQAVPSAATYAQMLFDLGAKQIVALEKIYPHELPDSDAALEWMRGTTIVPYLERLPRDRHAAFLDRLREAMCEAMPQRPLFFGFKRTLFAGSRMIKEDVDGKAQG